MNDCITKTISNVNFLLAEVDSGCSIQECIEFLQKLPCIFALLLKHINIWLRETTILFYFRVGQVTLFVIDFFDVFQRGNIQVTLTI